MTDTLTGELVELHGDRNLFHAPEPVDVLDRARSVAIALKSDLNAGGMIVKVGRSEHVTIDGWQTCGAMLGISPHIIWSRPLEGGTGWEARAEARTVDGRIVGSAEAMVTRDERNWKGGDDYALRSMAQTRAMSKALRAPLGFIVALGGINTTPAEEIVPEPPAAGMTVMPSWAQPVPDVGSVANTLIEILRHAGVQDPAEHVNRVGQSVMDACEGTIPVCVRGALEQLADVMDDYSTTGAEQAPDTPIEPETDTPQ